MRMLKLAERETPLGLPDLLGDVDTCKMDRLRPPKALERYNTMDQGQVRATLAIDPLTGEVTSVSAEEGHRILVDSVRKASETWTVEPPAPPSLTVTVDFAFNCQVPR